MGDIGRYICYVYCMFYEAMISRIMYYILIIQKMLVLVKCFLINPIGFSVDLYLSPSAAYMRQWIASALVQIMASRLYGAKPPF